MKITLGIDINYSGYENLGIIKSLDPYAMNAQCTEILALGIINYIEVEKIDAFLMHLISKLRHGGKLTVTGRDIYSIANMIMTQPAGTDMVTLNKIIYGEHDKRPLASQVHVNYVTDILQKYGLKIMRKSYEAGEYVVDAVRP